MQRNLAEEDEVAVEPCKHFTGLAHILWWTLSALRKNETINRTFDGYDDFLCLSDGLSKQKRVVCVSEILIGKLDVSELLNIFEEELAVANPFNEEHAEQISTIRNNVSDILDNLYGYVRGANEILS